MKDVDYRVEIPDIDREFFLKKVEKTETCWLWRGAMKNTGYGEMTLRVNGKKKYFRAHRVSFKIFKDEELEQGLVIDHICRNKACVNPEHLRQVSYRTNVLENSVAPAALNSAKVMCPRGHLYDEANTSFNSSNGRLCNECNRISSISYYHKNKDSSRSERNIRSLKYRTANKEKINLRAREIYKINKNKG